MRDGFGYRDATWGPRKQDPASNARIVGIATRTEPETVKPLGQVDRGRHRSRYAIGLALIVPAGLGIRVGYVLAGGAQDTSSDGLYYHLAGNAIAEGRGYVNPWTGAPTALHPPAWSTLLALPSVVGLDTLLAHQLFAVVVGATTIVLVGLAGRAIAGPRAGLVAAAIAATYPIMWVRERELAAETLVLPLVAIALLLAYRYWTEPRTVTLAAIGAVCGLVALVRAEQALLLGLLLSWLALRAGRESPLSSRVRRLLAGTAAAVVVVTPWIVHNTTRFERPVLLTTSLGLNLRVGNCPAAYYGERTGSFDPDIFRPPASVPPAGCVWDAESTDEAELDAEFRDKGLEYMRGHAERLPAVVAAREGRTWGVFRPFQQARFEQQWGGGPIGVYQAGVAFSWALVPFAVAGLLRLRASAVPLFPLISFLLVVAVAVAITHGMVRYRAPAEVSIVVLAAAGVDALLDRLPFRALSARGS